MSSLKLRKMKTIKDILLISLVLTCIVLFGFLNYYQKAYKSEKAWSSLWEAQADTLLKNWDAQSQQWEFSRLQYEATEKELRGFLKDRDKRLYELAKKKDVRDVTEIETVIKYDTTVNTVVRDNIHYATITDKWMEAHIISRPDSTSLKQQINMPLTILKGYDGRITATTPIPYIDVVELKGFTKIEPDRKRNWKYWVGGLIGGALIYGVTR